MHVILASRSPRRMELLRQIIPQFEVIPSDAPEILDPARPAAELAETNARAKAASVAQRFPEALVIGADTLVFLDDVVFGKPANLAEAERMLETLSGRTHQVVTGICLVEAALGREKAFSVITDVTFRKLSRREIGAYLRSIDPLDKAGAYAIQQNGDWIVEGTSGSYSNVVGLPLERLETELQEWPG